MIQRFTSLILGFALTAFAGVAAARDYIVVGSTDPAIGRGQAYDSGARVALAPGRTLTLMHATGDLVRLKGAASGVLLPPRQANQAEADRLAILRVIVARADQRAAGGIGLTRRRSGICPDVSAIVTLDAIVQVHQGGCTPQAVEALEAWIDAHPPMDA